MKILVSYSTDSVYWDYKGILHSDDLEKRFCNPKELMKCEKGRSYKFCNWKIESLEVSDLQEDWIWKCVNEMRKIDPEDEEI